MPLNIFSILFKQITRIFFKFCETLAIESVRGTASLNRLIEFQASWASFGVGNAKLTDKIL